MNLYNCQLCTNETKHVLVLVQSFLLSLFPLTCSSVERLVDWEA